MNFYPPDFIGLPIQRPSFEDDEFRRILADCEGIVDLSRADNAHSFWDFVEAAGPDEYPKHYRYLMEGRAMLAAGYGDGPRGMGRGATGCRGCMSCRGGMRGRGGMGSRGGMMGRGGMRGWGGMRGRGCMRGRGGMFGPPGQGMGYGGGPGTSERTRRSGTQRSSTHRAQRGLNPFADHLEYRPRPGLDNLGDGYEGRAAAHRATHPAFEEDPTRYPPTW